MRAYGKTSLFYYCVITAAMLLTGACAYAQKGLATPGIWVQAVSDNDSTVKLLSKGEKGDKVIFKSKADGQMNYNPSITYMNGEKGLFVPYRMKSSTDLNVFVVYEPAGSKSPSALWAVVPDSAENIQFTTQTLRKRSGRVITYADTTLQSAVINLYMDKWTGLEIGDDSHVMLLGDDSTRYSGKFCEFMYYDRPMDALELCKVYSYLVMKYSITVQGQDLISSANDTIWRYEENTEHPYEMAVLCRDDGYGVHQKQCGANCGTSELALYVGKLRESNRQNEVELKDGSYLVATSNGEAISSTADTIYSGHSAEFYLRTRKEWKISTAGQDFRMMPVSLKLKYENGSDTLVPNLFIVRTDSLTYTPGEMEVIAPDSSDADGYYYYNNIKWDTDGSGSDRFSFGTVFVDKALEEQTEQETAEIADSYNNGDSGIGGGHGGNGKTDSGHGDGSIDTRIMGVDVFPNPCYGDFVVTVDLADAQKFNIRIVGVDGKHIWNSTIDGQRHYEARKHIEMSGTYLIEVSTSSDKLSKAIVVY